MLWEKLAGCVQVEVCLFNGSYFYLSLKGPSMHAFVQWCCIGLLYTTIHNVVLSSRVLAVLSSRSWQLHVDSNPKEYNISASWTRLFCMYIHVYWHSRSGIYGIDDGSISVRYVAGYNS